MLRSLYKTAKQALPTPIRRRLGNARAVLTLFFQRTLLRWYNKNYSHVPHYAKCLAGVYCAYPQSSTTERRV